MAAEEFSNLSKAQRDMVIVSGFNTKSEVLGLGPVALMKEMGCSIDTAKAIINELQPAAASATGSSPPSSLGTSVLDLLAKPQAGQVVTFCKPLDDMLGGGVACGEITEFCGVPGVGKTQVCMQIAADAMVPTQLGGIGGGTLYIDTEGSFMVQRQQQIAEALSQHLEVLANKKRRRSGGTDAASAAQEFAVPSCAEILSNIHVLRATTAAEQLAAVLALPKLLESLSNVRVVVLDSMAFHFRHTSGDFASRSRSIRAISDALRQLAAKETVAIVVTNHMTNRKDQSTGEFVMVPALGESWAHVCTNRVLLTWQGSIRTACLVKAAGKPPAACLFSVTADGIRRVRAS